MPLQTFNWWVYRPHNYFPIINPRVLILVVGTYEEPHVGWVDNMFGPTGVVVGVGCGLIRVGCCHKDKTAELVPADYVTNALIAATYKTAVERLAPQFIFTYSLTH